MAISLNYTGRTVDVCILETNALPGAQDVTVGISGSGTVISGPYKIVQKFTQALFTDLGSVPGDPTYGTEFSTLIFSGQIQTSLSLNMEFYAAAPSVMAYIRAHQTDATPLDEQLRKVVLSSFATVPGALRMTISFEFEDASTILAPVSIPIG